MNHRTLLPLFPAARGLWAVALAAAFGCGGLYGGQSFDDGSGDVGRGKRSRSDVGRASLALQPSVQLRAPYVPQAPFFDGSSRFIGDLNADGYADFALVAWKGVGPDWEPGKQNAYVFYGRPQFPAELELEDADFIVEGVQSQLTPIGDFNGDGFDDVGFFGEGWAGTWGRFDLLLGGRERHVGRVPARTLETSIGSGPPNSALAWLGDPAAPGDVNGDGYADLVLGSALVLGRAEPYGQTSLVGTGTVAAMLAGRVDRNVRAGDVDGDGYDDLLLRTERPSDGISGTLLYYGRANWGSTLDYGRSDWSSAPDAVAPDAVFPGRMWSMGDWDGDGYGDLARVQQLSTSGGENNRELWALDFQLSIVYGGLERFRDAVALSTPTPQGQRDGEELALQDVNGDRRPDLLLASPFSPREQQEGAGALFFLPNAASERLGEVRLQDRDAVLRGQTDGTVGDYLGRGVSVADVNGDSYADVLVVQEGWRDSLGATLIFGGPEL